MAALVELGVNSLLALMLIPTKPATRSDLKLAWFRLRRQNSASGHSKIVKTSDLRVKLLNG